MFARARPPRGNVVYVQNHVAMRLLLRGRTTKNQGRLRVTLGKRLCLTRTQQPQVVILFEEPVPGPI